MSGEPSNSVAREAVAPGPPDASSIHPTIIPKHPPRTLRFDARDDAKDKDDRSLLALYSSFCALLGRVTGMGR